MCHCYLEVIAFLYAYQKIKGVYFLRQMLHCQTSFEVSFEQEVYSHFKVF